MAIGGGLLAESAKEPYLARIDAICKARVEAQSRTGRGFLDALSLSL